MALYTPLKSQAEVLFRFVCMATTQKPLQSSQKVCIASKDTVKDTGSVDAIPDGSAGLGVADILLPPLLMPVYLQISIDMS